MLGCYSSETFKNFETTLSLAWNSPTMLGCQAGEPQQVTCLCLRALGYMPCYNAWMALPFIRIFFFFLNDVCLCVGIYA